jgi:hypothetical protein
MLAFDFNGDLSDIASIATILAALAGSIFALRYGRKANAIVTGGAQRMPDGDIILSARLSVQSAGFRQLKIRDPRFTMLSISEVSRQGVSLDSKEVIRESNVLHQDLVAPGETVTTSLEYNVGAPNKNVVGWALHFAVVARRQQWLARRHRLPEEWTKAVEAKSLGELPT